MTLVGAGATTSMVIGALGRVAISILLAMAGGLVLLRVLPHLPFGRRLVLDDGMHADLRLRLGAGERPPVAGPDGHGPVAAAAGGHRGDRRRTRRCRVGRRLHRGAGPPLK